MVLFIKFSRLPSSRKFDYQPLYYDPVKEELEQRIENAEKKAKGEFKGNITHLYRQNRQFSRSEHKTRSMRLLIIVIILSLIAYYLFY